MASLPFYKQNFQWLFACALMTFSSSYGQTYFISIFAGEIRAEFGLTHSGWGTIYMIGTLSSAMVMAFAGGLMDRFRARSLGIILLCSIAASSVLMSFNTSLVGLVMTIFLLRFFGQGMLAQLPKIAISRWFEATRGRALSISSLGFSIGEASLPILFVAVSAIIGWRSSWLLASILALSAAPILLVLLRKERTPKSEVEETQVTGMQGKHWSRMGMFKHPLFWFVLPTWLAAPTFNTAFFFHQVHFSQIKGWDHIDFVALIPIYTVGTVIAVMSSGFLIDRFKTGILVPLYTLPLALSFFIFSEAQSLFAAAFGFVLFSVTAGFFNTTSSTFWVEYYGTKYLGTVKSAAVFVMVLGTAIGPWFTGWLIDHGVGFEQQLIGMSAYIVIASIISGFGIFMVRKDTTHLKVTS